MNPRALSSGQKKIGLAIAGGACVIGLVVWYALAQPQDKRVYTLADFPNATQYQQIEPEELERRVRVLNEIYALLGTEGGKDDSYNWLRIGTIKKIMGDPEGAERAWQESLKLAKSSVIFGNLASLYYLDLNEPEKAIDYYNQALAIAPENFSFYQDLAGVYRYKLGNSSDLVEGVLLRGAAASPAGAAQYYLYLVDYFDQEKNIVRRDYYVDKIMASDPPPDVRKFLQSGGFIQ